MSRRVPNHRTALLRPVVRPNPNWSRTYATQPEILAHIEDCNDRFDVSRKVRCSTEVVAAGWDEEETRWVLRSTASSAAATPSSGAAYVDIRPEAMARYVADLEAALATTVWDGGCDSYFRTAAGDIVTQLPHTADEYREQTARFPTEDFHLGPSERPGRLVRCAR